jgi:hypothetical protein
VQQDIRQARQPAVDERSPLLGPIFREAQHQANRTPPASGWPGWWSSAIELPWRGGGAAPLN